MGEQELKQEIENLKAELNLAKAETANAIANGKLAQARYDNEVGKLARRLKEAMDIIARAAEMR